MRVTVKARHSLRPEGTLDKARAIDRWEPNESIPQSRRDG